MMVSKSQSKIDRMSRSNPGSADISKLPNTRATGTARSSPRATAMARRALPWPETARHSTSSAAKRIPPKAALKPVVMSPAT